MWHRVQLEPIVSGCPNRCRHCSDEGEPPFGALMGLDEVKWLVDEFACAFEKTVGKPPEIRAWLDGFEPTVHTDFVRLKEYERSLLSEARRHEFDTLSSNGYGLARADDWQAAYQALAAVGFTGIGFAIHGLEEEHDWFVRRPGAYRDVMVAIERTLASGMRVQVWISINVRNVASFTAIKKVLEDRGGASIKVLTGVPAFFPNERLRAFEALRPTSADVQPIVEDLSHMAWDADTAAHWTRRLLDAGREACPHRYESAGKGPSQRTLGRFRITPDFDVRELFFSRPALEHGNIRRDGIDRVWRSVLEADLPALPEPEELAALYGDLQSERLHPGGDSVYMRLCDTWWQREGG